jgi:hypothetical protein
MAGGVARYDRGCCICQAVVRLRAADRLSLAVPAPMALPPDKSGNILGSLIFYVLKCCGVADTTRHNAPLSISYRISVRVVMGEKVPGPSQLPRLVLVVGHPFFF